MTGRVSIVWFRRDLRIRDNEALHAGVSHSAAVVPLVVLDPRLLDRGGNRVAFYLASVRALAGELAARGSGLVVRIGEPTTEVPRVAAETGARRVFASRDYTAFGCRRDAEVDRLLRALGSALDLRQGVLVAEPGDIRSAAGHPFARFAPFRRQWLRLQFEPPVPAPEVIRSLEIGGSQLPESPPPPDGGLEPGEAAAQARMAIWLRDGLARYAALRNRLDVDVTSRLSQDLRFGLISPRELRTGTDPAEHEAFLSELAWREFAYHVAWHRQSAEGARFAPRSVAFAWQNDPAEIAAWRAGRTGYPVVDAAMRQLLATGFMPNRARMVAASFLTKHLLSDWRIGEAHFMRHLIDGDPAINRYNWEWVASVGVDAQPPFRVLNPVLQGRRYDANGEYVRRWVPELAGIEGPAVHEPWRPATDLLGATAGSYPRPIVDHAAARARALEAFGAKR